MNPTQKIIELFMENALDGTVIPVKENISQYGEFSLSCDQDAKPERYPIKAAIFDIYGTLFMSSSGDIGSDDSEKKTDQLQALFHRYGIHTRIENITSDLREGIEKEHVRKQALGIDYPEVDIRNVWQGVEQMASMSWNDLALFAAEYESLVNPVAPMPTLEQLLQCADVPLGVVSNAQFYTPILFEAFLGQSMQSLGFHPNLQVYSYIEGHAKPSLGLYKRVVENLQGLENPLLPWETLYVGNDMLKDIWPAKQFGFRTAFFAGDARSFRPRKLDARCENIKADYVIDQLSDLCKLLTF